MKYLKKFKIFESDTEDTDTFDLWLKSKDHTTERLRKAEDILLDIKDILLPLSDDGIDVRLEKVIFNSNNSMNIGIKINNRTDLDFSNYISDFEHLFSYLKSANCDLYDNSKNNNSYYTAFNNMLGVINPITTPSLFIEELKKINPIYIQLIYMVNSI